MTNFQEIKSTCYISLNSVSTSENLELFDGSPSPLIEKFVPLNPCKNKTLFKTPSEERSVKYSVIFPRVLDIIEELYDSLTPISIKDDYCLEPKTVFLRVPNRRRTLGN